MKRKILASRHARPILMAMQFTAHMVLRHTGLQIQNPLEAQMKSIFAQVMECDDLQHGTHFINYTYYGPSQLTKRKYAKKVSVTWLLCQLLYMYI
jgi:hypothetical protein